MISTLRRTTRVLAAISLAAVATCSRPPITGPTPAGEPGPTTTYVPGRSYFGTSQYVEYIAGNAPVILTAPHGGALRPSSIPDRTADRCGGTATTVTDRNTIELVRAMRDRYFARFGKYPHVVIAHLARIKMDANRTEPEATCDVGDAAVALREWHTFIDVAKRSVLETFGKGWYMDMHGHGHTVQRLELGYLIGSADLDRGDANLNTPEVRDVSSIRTIAKTSRLSHAELLRGPSSLGTLYASNGFPSVPSEQDPSPNGAVFFGGGDNTRRHTCGAEANSFGGTTDGLICGVQIESNFTGVRDTPANRERFGDVTARVLEQFLQTQWGLKLAAP